MTKRHAPPPSSEEAIAELEMLPQISDDETLLSLAEIAEIEARVDAEIALLIPAPVVETISVTDLALLSILERFERIASAAETANKLRHSDIIGLTAALNSLAKSFDEISSTLNAVTQRVEGADGVVRGLIRHDRTTCGLLSYADDREIED